jgi:hypothetical protein
MRKIPTLFIRDPDDRRQVLSDVTPGCEWVLAGEGEPTRKYDGICLMHDGQDWWARREVKPGKIPPPNYKAISTDDVTGKTMGWEPLAQSSFAKYAQEALNSPWGIADVDPAGKWSPPVRPVPNATYELVGQKINRNPERIEVGHLLIRHGYTAAVDRTELGFLPCDYEGLRAWLQAHPQWEGIVWHHPDGRMAKLKGRDFPRTS